MTLRSEVWRCGICRKWFWNRKPGEPYFSCAVYHSPGTCCHYGDQETEAPIMAHPEDDIVL